MTRYYAGIGWRDTPETILTLMSDLASRLEGRGFHLLSGGARGADKAFFRGTTVGSRTIFLPWNGYEGQYSGADFIVAPELPNWHRAEKIARTHHPRWERCGQGARKLLARNGYQVLTATLDRPVDLIVAYTDGGRGGGGTGQALRVARKLAPHVPIYDLGLPEVREKFESGWLPV